MQEKSVQTSTVEFAKTASRPSLLNEEVDVLANDEQEPGRPRASFFRRYRWLALALVIAAAAAWYLFSGSSDAPSSAPLTVTVEYGDIENAVTAAGTLQPKEYVDVGAQVSGQLKKLYVEVGDEVKAGDLLAEIDATVQQSKVDASRASIEALQAQLSARESSLDLAKARMERQTRMMEEDATSQDDYDDAVDRVTSAESSLVQLRSQIAQATASLASDEATLGYSKIYAPTDGTVVSISMKEGQTLNSVQQAPTILRIADLSTMTVEAEVSEADVSKLNDGMEVYFTTLGGGERRWTGELRQILPTPEVQNNVVLYTALFDVDNTDGTLLTEMTAQVFFVTESARNVLKIPVGALVTGTGAAGRSAGNGSPSNVAEGGPGAGSGPQAPGGGAQFAGTPPAGGPGGGAGAPGAGERPSGAPFAGGAAGGAPFAGGAAGGARGARARAGGFSQPDTGPGEPATVRVVLDDGTVETRSIRIGVKSRISAEVLSGLKEGDKVVAGIVDTGTTQGESNRRGGPFGPF